MTAMTLACKAERYMNDPTFNWTDEKVTQRGLYGTFKNDEITFAPNSLSINFAAAPFTWYDANQNGHFRLKFEPGQIKGGQSGISVIESSDNNMPVEYYTIDGMRISSENMPSGMYIVRQGGNVKKIWK